MLLMPVRMTKRRIPATRSNAGTMFACAMILVAATAIALVSTPLVDAVGRMPIGFIC
jgi:hypothetical protein